MTKMQSEGRAGWRRIAHDHLFTIVLVIELAIGMVVIALVNGVR